MTPKVKVALFIAGVLGCTLILQRCNKPTTVKGPAQITYQGGGDVLVISQPNHPDIKMYQPDPKSTVIKTDAHGNVTVQVRQFGVGFEPGIGIGYSDRTRLALDARLVYYKRIGFNAGLGLSLDPEQYKARVRLLDLVDPYAGMSFVPTIRLPNTSIVVAGTMSKRIFVFARWRF